MNDRLSFERSSLERPSERSSFDRGSSFDQQQDRVRISITESDRPRASFAFESRLLPLVVESVRDSSVWWWILRDACGLTRSAWLVRIRSPRERCARVRSPLLRVSLPHPLL